MALYGRLIAPHVSPETASWGLPIIFICAIVMSFFIYRGGVKLFAKKVDIEKNFDPLFGRRRPSNKE
jgi:hypothetical protein